MPTANEPEIIHVHIGEVKLGDSSTVLKTILGSCVGIALIWRRENKVALAHCLLPHGEDFVKRGKFVSQAVDSLLSLLNVAPHEVREIEAVLAGGASMYEEIQSGFLKVGDHNAKRALECLSSRKIRIIFQDLGGSYGRQLSIGGKNFEYQVRVLESPRKEIA